MMQPEQVGIAVNQLATSVPIFEKLLNSQCNKTEQVESERVTTIFFKSKQHDRTGGGMDQDGIIAGFIGNKDEGMPQKSFGVKDMESKRK